jgi:predicted MFS family arabinose efflux permease
VALAAFLWQWMSLPPMHIEPRKTGPGHAFRLFRNPVVTLGMLGVGLFFMGQFTLFTYVRPFLETVTQVDDSMVTMILLIIGVAGFIGTTLIGTVLKRGIYRTLIGTPVLMAAVAVSLIEFGNWSAAVVVLLGFWGLIATAAPVGWWVWVPRTFPQDAEAGGGLMVAVVQFSIALGSTAGGLLFDHNGYKSMLAASAAILLLAVLLISLAARAETTRAYERCRLQGAAP